MILTPEQQDVVERTRANMRRAQQRRGGHHDYPKRQPEGVPPLSHQAAVYARENGVTLTSAAERFGITRRAVALVWEKLFPGEAYVVAPGKRRAP